MEMRGKALENAESVAVEMESRKLKEAAKCLREGIGETTTYLLLDDYPREHRRRIRTNNMIERLNREIRRRTRVVGSFPDGRSAWMPVCARIRYVTSDEWSTRRYRLFAFWCVRAVRFHSLCDQESEENRAAW